MGRPVLTIPQGFIEIPGNHFVLTGKMWSVRKDIEHLIQKQHGFTSGRVTTGSQVLVVANAEADSGMLASQKVKDARRVHAAIIRERMLKRALDGFGAPQRFEDIVKQLKHDNPGLELNFTSMDETSKLLASF